MRVVAALALVACRSECEPVITGGTGAERAEIAAHVTHFLDILRPDLAICVPEVKVDEVRWRGATGRYAVVGRTVKVDPGSDVLFHELCHAVDRQNGIDVSGWEPTPGTAWDALADGKASQAFADFCSYGPTYAWFVADECPGDPPGMQQYRDAAALFVGPDPSVVDADLAPEVVPLVELPTTAAGFDLLVGEGGVVVELDDVVLALDPWNGAEVPRPADAMAPGDRVDTSLGIAWRFGYETLDGAVGHRWLLERERWSSLGCAGETHQVFAYDDWLWSARLAEGRLTLGVWTVP